MMFTEHISRVEYDMLVTAYPHFMRYAWFEHFTRTWWLGNVTVTTDSEEWFGVLTSKLKAIRGAK